MPTTYKIGKITLTQQALAVFILGSLITLFSLLVHRNVKGAGMALAFFAYTCYTTYLTNCVVVGNCKELAWVLVALNIISTIGIGMRIRKM